MESLLPETPPSQFSTLCGYPSSLETEELELLLETVRRFGREALDSAKIEGSPRLVPSRLAASQSHWTLWTDFS
jgi:hypothetical protein